jgi:hypothetical protein
MVGVVWLIGRHHPGWIVAWAILMVVVLAVVLVLKGYPTDLTDEADDPAREDL